MIIGKPAIAASLMVEGPALVTIMSEAAMIRGISRWLLTKPNM